MFWIGKKFSAKIWVAAQLRTSGAGDRLKILEENALDYCWLWRKETVEWEMETKRNCESPELVWRKFYHWFGDWNKFSTMKIRKLHLIVIASLINFGLLLQHKELKYYKPSGEKLERISTHRQITSNDLAKRRHASLISSFRFRKH